MEAFHSWFIFFLSIHLILAINSGKFDDINYKEALFIIPGGEGQKKIERDVPICPVSISVDNRTESACNLVEKRYFYPLSITRLCRCPDRSHECPWEYSQVKVVEKPNAPFRKRLKDSFTMQVNSRTQMKFCNDVQKLLPKCQKDMLLVQKILAGVPYVNVSCYCPLSKTWNLIDSNEFEEGGNLVKTFYYQCEKLPRCKTNELCGQVTKSFGIYYKCTCPKEHICFVKETEEESQVEELFYKEEGRNAYCLPELKVNSS